MFVLNKISNVSIIKQTITSFQYSDDFDESSLLVRLNNQIVQVNFTKIDRLLKKSH